MVLVAFVVAGLLFWFEFRGRGWIPSDRPLPENLVGPIRATEGLANRGPDGVPELLERLSDPDARIRRFALLGLSQIGPSAQPALDPIRQAFADRDAVVRSDAIRAYCRISEDLAAAAPILAAVLVDEDVHVRESAREELIAIGAPAIGVVIATLESEVADARREALTILSRLRRWDSAEAIDKAARARLEDADSGVRRAALAALVEWESATAAEIRQHLQSGGWETALRAAAHLGTDAAELLPDVMTLLDQTEHLEVSAAEAARVRLSPADIGSASLAPRARGALNVLRAMKTAARPAVPILLRRIDELTKGNRVAFALVLFEIGADANDVARILTPLLTGLGGQGIERSPAPHENQILQTAGAILAQANPAAARQVVTLLIRQMRAAEPDTSKTALYAIRGLAREADEAVGALMSLIPHSDWELYSNAVMTLGEIGPDAVPAVEVLLAQLAGEGKGADRGAEIRQRIIQALGKVGPGANRAVPILLTIVDDPAKFVPSGSRYEQSWVSSLRLAAVRSAAHVGENDPQVLAMLRAQIESGTPECRAAAATGFVLAARQSPEIWEEAISLLSSDNGIIRGRAALAIGELSGDRVAAVEPLRNLLRDESPYVQAAAAVALGKIGPPAAAARGVLKELQHREGIRRPLPSHPPYRSLDGTPTVDHIPELDQLTIDRAVRDALAAIEAEG